MRQRQSRLTSVNHRPLRIGCGAGYSGDRIEPAVELAEHGDTRLPRVRVPGRAHDRARPAGARGATPPRGFDPAARGAHAGRAARLRGGDGITRHHQHGRRQPAGRRRDWCARRARRWACAASRIAAVTGDDVLDAVRAGGSTAASRPDEPVATLGNRSCPPMPTSAPSPSSTALARGRRRRRHRPRRRSVAVPGAADRTTFGWAHDDWPRSAAARWSGHLLECAGQVTGGYFADPGVKDVPDLARLGFPLAEVGAGRQRRRHQGRRARAGRSPSPPARSSCSTRCTTRRPTSRRTWSPTSAASASTTGARPGAVSRRRAGVRGPTR